MVLIPKHHLPAKAERQFHDAVVLQTAVETTAQKPEAGVETEVEVEVDAGHDKGQVTRLRAAAVAAVTVPVVIALPAVTAVTSVTAALVLMKTTAEKKMIIPLCRDIQNHQIQ